MELLILEIPPHLGNDGMILGTPGGGTIERTVTARTESESITVEEALVTARQ